jgi:ribonuclease D
MKLIKIFKVPSNDNGFFADMLNTFIKQVNVVSMHKHILEQGNDNMSFVYELEYLPRGNSQGTGVYYAPAIEGTAAAAAAATTANNAGAANKSEKKSKDIEEWTKNKDTVKNVLGRELAQIFDNIRDARKKVAEDAGLTAAVYTVFYDRHLYAIMGSPEQNIEELKNVKGISREVEKWGEKLLEAYKELYSIEMHEAVKNAKQQASLDTRNKGLSFLTFVYEDAQKNFEKIVKGVKDAEMIELYNKNMRKNESENNVLAQFPAAKELNFPA